MAIGQMVTVDTLKRKGKEKSGTKVPQDGTLLLPAPSEKCLPGPDGRRQA
jgi:hypothetical protein